MSNNIETEKILDPTLRGLLEAHEILHEAHEKSSSGPFAIWSFLKDAKGHVDRQIKHVMRGGTVRDADPAGSFDRYDDQRILWEAHDSVMSVLPVSEYIPVTKEEWEAA